MGTADWRLLRLTDSSGALVLRHENRAKSLPYLGQSAGAGVGKQQ